MICGAIYFFYSGGKVSAGFVVIPALFNYFLTKGNISSE
jgi:hypothetical protein